MRRVIRIFRTICQGIVDIFFPKFCFGCKKEGCFLCEMCRKSILLFSAEHQSCPVCHRKSSGGIPCVNCKDISYLDALFVMSSYEHPLVASLVQNFKYRFVRELEKYFTVLFQSFFARENFTRKFDSSWKIIPIPLAKRRFRERGFNQAEILANCLSRVFSLQVDTKLMRRTRYTLPQANFSRAERLKNMRGAFRIIGARAQGQSVKNENYILVDDVFSTGSTMQECAKLLKSAGAKNVVGVVVARGGK